MDERKRIIQDQCTDRISQLLARYVRNELNEAERVELNQWLDADARHMMLFDTLKDGSAMGDALSTFSQPDTDRALYQLQVQMSTASRSAGGETKRIWKWVSYAAAALVTVTTVVWYFFDNPQQSSDGSPIVDLQSEDIPPGGNRATLTLADGRTITLDEAQNGIVIGGGEIIYNDGNRLAEVGSEESAVLLELSTPKGGTYQATLSDGTKVWLNAGSTLKYPSRFTNDERKVFLEGEAYFEVPQVKTQAGRIPFEVVSDNQTVVVLGTEFNISAYSTDARLKTTLVAGSVEVVNHQSKTTNRIKPGQQAVVAGADTDIGEVDIYQYTAWKNGLFYFDGLSPEVAFNQLARWYDLDVVFMPKESTFKFFGVIERDKSLGSILNILGKSGLKFEVRNDAGRNQLIILNE